MRTRVTLFFSLTALAAGLSLTAVTYTVARSYLLDQRTSVARQQALINANIVREQLRTDRRNIGTFFPTLRTENEGFAMLRLGNGDQLFANNSFQNDAFPIALQSAVEAGSSGLQRFGLRGEPYLAFGVDMRQVDAKYFEAFPLGPTDRTLRAIGTALLLGAGATTLLAAGLGWWTSRRLLRPLSRVATAAGEIASGGLDTRLAPETDPDLARLVSSFNEMADAVQTRIEREARFASDVSHELRSPITALSAAVEVLDARREDLPDRTRQALDVVVTQVRRFDQMVMDLLELSRIDAGTTELHREAVHVAELARRIAQRYGFGSTPVEISGRAPTTAHLDKLRFERILANLLDNAGQHGGGATRIAIEPGHNGFQLAVEDAGPGVARGERSRIFERYARGSAARHRVGTGLGLALVAEHAQAHGGEAWVEDRPGGGARFVVSFPEAR